MCLYSCRTAQNSTHSIKLRHSKELYMSPFGSINTMSYAVITNKIDFISLFVAHGYDINSKQDNGWVCILDSCV